MGVGIEASDVGFNGLSGRARSSWLDDVPSDEGLVPEEEDISNDQDYIREQPHIAIAIHIENVLTDQRVEVGFNFLSGLARGSWLDDGGGPLPGRRGRIE